MKAKPLIAYVFLGLLIILLTFLSFVLFKNPFKTEKSLLSNSLNSTVLEETGKIYLQPFGQSLSVGTYVEKSQDGSRTIALEPATQTLLLFTEGRAEAQKIAHYVDVFKLHTSGKHLYYFKQTAYIDEQRIGQAYYMDLDTLEAFEIDNQVVVNSFRVDQSGQFFSYMKVERLLNETTSLEKSYYLQNIKGEKKRLNLEATQEMLYLAPQAEFVVMAKFLSQKSLNEAEKLEDQVSYHGAEFSVYFIQEDKQVSLFQEETLLSNDVYYGYHFYYAPQDRHFLFQNDQVQHYGVLQSNALKSIETVKRKAIPFKTDFLRQESYILKDNVAFVSFEVLHPLNPILEVQHLLSSDLLENTQYAFDFIPERAAVLLLYQNELKFFDLKDLKSWLSEQAEDKLQLNNIHRFLKTLLPLSKNIKSFERSAYAEVILAKKESNNEFLSLELIYTADKKYKTIEIFSEDLGLKSIASNQEIRLRYVQTTDEKAILFILSKGELRALHLNLLEKNKQSLDRFDFPEIKEIFFMPNALWAIYQEKNKENTEKLNTKAIEIDLPSLNIQVLEQEALAYPQRFNTTPFYKINGVNTYANLD